MSSVDNNCQLPQQTSQERSTNLGDHESLDLSGVRNMRADAKIDHGTTTVDRGGGTIGNFGLDEVLLVFVVLQRLIVSLRVDEWKNTTYAEHLEEGLFWDHQAFKLLAIFDSAFSDFLQGWVVRHGYSPE